ncbi:MAG: NAD(P)H-hydrate dehydratase [Dehalococcoidia bacterium]|jgi:NAD(P)H-hydrate repair Nnr-like enzyme with NAD(P)H-hydrate dehydratase domain
MMLIAGTVPIEGLPLVMGEVARDGDFLLVDGKQIPATQGTGAMVSAALATTSYLGIAAPHALLVGDIGEGKGSRELYQYLIDHVAELNPEVLALHYWLPDMSQTRQLCAAVEKCQPRPVMIADAASMYSAKAAGLAEEFDIFTPDSTEIAFLADPEATHPAYIARHLFETDVSNVTELAKTAYANHGAAKLLLVKGATDYIIKDGEVLAMVNEPNVPMLEPIGGTGDTITGVTSALAYAELEPDKAALIAAKVNRMAGKYAKVTPATKVNEVIAHFPVVFKDNLCQWSGACFI